MKELLTFDIGNSRPSVALFQEGALKDVFSLAHFEENYLPQFSHATYCHSIVGKAPALLNELSGQPIDLRAHWSGGQFFGMPTHYAATLGDDRLYACAYAWLELKQKNLKSALILDLGTFMTFDWVQRDQGHLGGVISPGLSTYLNNFARGELLKVYAPEEINWSPTLTLPTETQAAITTSARWYFESMLERATEQMPNPEVIFITGGSAEVALRMVAKMNLASEIVHVPHLVHLAMHRLTELLDH